MAMTDIVALVHPDSGVRRNVHPSAVDRFVAAGFEPADEPDQDPDVSESDTTALEAD